MQLELSKKEFRRLLDLVYIGNWILNSTRGDDRIADYDQVESKLFALCRENGMPSLVERWNGEDVPSRAFSDGGIHEAIADYEDTVFYEILAEELARRVSELEAREVAFAERQRRAEAETVVTAAVREGRLTPAQSEGLAAFMASLSESDTIAFSEGGKELSPVAFMKTFLSRLPVQVEFAEKSAGADETIDGLSPLDAANRAVAYQERMKRDGVVITTTEALSAVKAGKDNGAQ